MTTARPPVRRYSAAQDEAAFHSQMAERPEDETTPLVYADWLEEHNRPGTAGVLRAHLENQRWWQQTAPEHATGVNVHSYPPPDSVRDMGQANITGNVGGMRWVSLALRSVSHPHLWFHWMTGGIASEKAEEIARGLHREGIVVNGDRAGATDFLNPQPTDGNTEPDRLSRGGPVRRYASQADIDTMLSGLTGDDRRGAFDRDADFTKRGVLADALEENGRADEAALLRSKHPVWVDNGRITGGYGNHLSEGYSSYEDSPNNPLTLCHNCANHAVLQDPSLPVFRNTPHWEGPPLTCDGCDGGIESSYGDPNEPDPPDADPDAAHYARGVRRRYARLLSPAEYVGHLDAAATARDSWHADAGQPYPSDDILALATRLNRAGDPRALIVHAHAAMMDGEPVDPAAHEHVSDTRVSRPLHLGVVPLPDGTSLTVQSHGHYEYPGVHAVHVEWNPKAGRHRFAATVGADAARDMADRFAAVDPAAGRKFHAALDRGEEQTGWSPDRHSRGVRRYALAHTPDDFHRQIAADSQNPFHALTYADFLQENGMPAHEKLIRDYAERYGTSGNVRPASEVHGHGVENPEWTTAFVTRSESPGGRWWDAVHTLSVYKRPAGSDKAVRWQVRGYADDVRDLIKKLAAEQPDGVVMAPHTDTLVNHLDEFRRRGTTGDNTPRTPTGDPQDAHLSQTIQRQGGTPRPYTPPDRMSRAGVVRRYMQYTHADFHRKILEDRSRTVPTLAYADFLEENDQPEAAELIREHVRQHTTDKPYDLDPGDAGGYQTRWATRSTAPPGQFWVYTARWDNGKTHVQLDQRTDPSSTAGLDWTAVIGDPAHADRLVNGLFAKGGTAHMGSFHQPAVPERPMTEEEIEAGESPANFREYPEGENFQLRRRYARLAPNVNEFGPAIRDAWRRQREMAGGIDTDSAYHQLQDHDILADHLADHGDPREAIVRGRIPGAMRAAAKMAGVGEHQGGTIRRHDFPDGTSAQVIQYPRGGSKSFMVEWGGTPDRNNHWPANIPWYATAMTGEDFRDWLNRFDDDLRPKFDHDENGRRFAGDIMSELPGGNEPQKLSRVARRYAAYRAPQGGMIAPPVSNDLGLPGQFYPGGRFVSDESVLPRKKKKIDLSAVRKRIRAKKLPPNPNADAGEPAKMARVVRRYAFAERGDFERAIDNDPTNATTHGAYADFLDEQGDHDEAAFRRAMGEWVQETIDRRPNKSLTSTIQGHKSFPFIAHPLHVPEGVDGMQLPVWNYGPGPDSFQDARGVHRPQDPTHAVYQTGLLRWQTYRNMEEAFRRAFMANRTRPTDTPETPDAPERLSRAGVVRKYALTGDPQDEAAIHHHLIYENDPGNMTPHLAYMDWLQENGREKLAEFLRRGVTNDVEGKRYVGTPSIYRGSDDLGAHYPATFRTIGYVGDLHLSAAKPKNDKRVVVSLTPKESYRDAAVDNGNPFHYKSVLTPDDAHTLAEELKVVNYQGGEPGETIGSRLKTLLGVWKIPDTRPRPTTPQVETQENPEQLSRVTRRYAASSEEPMTPSTENEPVTSENPHAPFLRAIDESRSARGTGGVWDWNRTPVLVYADFLEENRMPVLAQLVRDAANNKYHDTAVFAYDSPKRDPRHFPSQTHSVYVYSGAGRTVGKGRKRQHIPTKVIRVKSPDPDGRPRVISFETNDMPVESAQELIRSLISEGHPPGDEETSRYAGIK